MNNCLFLYKVQIDGLTEKLKGLRKLEKWKPFPRLDKGAQLLLEKIPVNTSSHEGEWILQ